MAAMLDELACLTRDLMILQTAPREGIALLSGVASDEHVQQLSGAFSPAELVRMLNLLQNTLAGFNRSASRRLDAELCVLNLCQPELSLDAQSLNARIGRVEEQLKNGNFTPSKPKPVKVVVPDTQEEAEEISAQPEDVVAPAVSEAPAGFWTDLAGELRSVLKPPVSGFFATTPNAPVQGALVGDTLELRCDNDFVMQTVGKPDILQLVSQKASAKLGTPVQAKAVDRNTRPESSKALNSLLDFGRAHSGLVNIKE